MRHITPTFVALLVSTVLSAACSNDVVGPRGIGKGEPLQTDALSYDAQSDGLHYSFRVVTTFRNTLDRTIYLDRCLPESPAPLFGVVAVDTAVGSAYGQIWACVGHDKQFKMAPGAMRIDTLTITGPNSWSSQGEPFGTTAGLNRIFFSAAFCADDCQDRVPRDALISNTFRVIPKGETHF